MVSLPNLSWPRRMATKFGDAIADGTSARNAESLTASGEPITRPIAVRAAVERRDRAVKMRRRQVREHVDQDRVLLDAQVPARRDVDHRRQADVKCAEQTGDADSTDLDLFGLDRQPTSLANRRRARHRERDRGALRERSVDDQVLAVRLDAKVADVRVRIGEDPRVQEDFDLRLRQVNRRAADVEVEARRIVERHDGGRRRRTHLRVNPVDAHDQVLREPELNVSHREDGRDVRIDDRITHGAASRVGHVSRGHGGGRRTRARGERPPRAMRRESISRLSAEMTSRSAQLLPCMPYPPTCRRVRRCPRLPISQGTV